MTTPSLSRAELWVRDGVATLGPELVGLRQALETRFLAWAAECGAEELLTTRLREPSLDEAAHREGAPH